MKIFYCVTLLMLVSFCSMGQGAHHNGEKSAKPETDSASFCKVLMDFIGEARRNFVHTKGNFADTSGPAREFSANRGLPGALTSAIVDNNGALQYEGVVYQGVSKENMQEVYAFNIYVLNGCLDDSGYVRTNMPNPQQGLEKFPLIRYDRPNTGAPWCMLSVAYSDINAIYTVTISVHK